MLELTSAPAIEPITLAELKSQLRIDHSDEDTHLGTLIAVSRLTIEARTGRALVTQTWKLSLDRFPPSNLWSSARAVIRLPKPPLQSVSDITYTALDGTPTVLSADVYQVHAPAGITPPTGWISLKQDQVWPSTADVQNAVQVTFVAGWETAGTSPDTADETPETLKLACKALASWFYEQRVPVNVGNIVNTLPLHVENLLSLYKVREF
jgi:uncharacterized phiE125 gp8 family phage protein